jgi:preprotein translocase subunit SecA
MTNPNRPGVFKHIYQKWTGSNIDYDLTSYRNVLAEVQRYQSELEACDEVDLKRRSSRLQQKAKTTPSVDSLLPEAYALVKEAVHRVLTLQAFDEQLMAAVAIHQGKLAEMQTGEGKTLAAVFPAYLNALSGCGVHVLTFNDYLARRDAQWMGPVYQYLGLQVEFVQEGMTVQQRQQAYGADITYLTAKEAGFDFLRDGLCYRREDIVQRNFHYVIVDEADSILIDEARVPLPIRRSKAGTGIYQAGRRAF